MVNAAVGSGLTYGVTLPDQPVAGLVDLARRAERGGFDDVWIFDSPAMDRDPYPLLAAIAAATSRVRFGTCVTNPATREPAVTASAVATLAEMSGGRVDLGIGRGDSALRLLGLPAASIAAVGDAARIIRELAEGRSVATAGGATLRLPYAAGHRLPVWIAGYGPRALELAATIADGVIIQVADPDLVAWFVEQVRAFAQHAGRDPAEVRVMVAATAIVGDDAEALERARWFPALVANHVIGLLRRRPKASLPAALTGYLDARDGDGYVEQRRGDNSFVDDETVRRMAIVGDVESHRQRLEELRAAGADQVNLYLERGAEAETLDAYASAIIGAASPA